MKNSEIKGYVVEDGFRTLNRWFIPFCGVFLTFCSVGCLRMAIVVQQNVMSNYIGALIFFTFAFILFRSRHYYSDVTGMHYFCENNTVTNQNGEQKHCLDTDNSFFISEVTVTFNVKGAWREHFFILSAEPLQIGSLETSGLKVIKNLWDRGIIIVPVNEETQVWIKQAVGISEVPKYPKVAYLQKRKGVS